MSGRALWVLALGCFGVLVASRAAFRLSPDSGSPSPPQEERARAAHEVRGLLEIYSRETNRFAEVWLHKPTEPLMSNPGHALSPLLLQEVRRANPEPPYDWRFGELFSSEGVLHVDVARPVVYLALSVTELNGRAHAQMSYFWFYGQAPGETKEGQIRVQGVRITLDDGGKPAVWEVFADGTGAQLVFVARTLEIAATKEYGRALPGRRYVVEPDLKAFPKVVVPRVVEDGPVAMGPILYLECAEGSVMTLICRCMPAQAEHVSGSTSYALVNTSTNTVERLLARDHSSLASKLTAWRTGEGEYRIDRRLRLPRSF